MTESQNVDESSADALVALSFLQQSDQEPAPPVRRGPRFEHSPSPPLEDNAKQASQEAPTEYRSSFAPSKQAAERKARSQAAQAASHAAVSKPGRPNGGAKIKKDRGAWESSEEEEEDEEEEEEEEASDEDGVAPGLGPARNQPQNIQGAGSMTDLHAGAHPRPPRLLPALPGQRPPGKFSHEYTFKSH
jgi:CCR4-NOT transcriptional complex subunit CAF120